MISVLIRIILAFLVFSFYNALSIKGFTDTTIWHLSQRASVIMFIFCGLENKLWALWASYRNCGLCRKSTLLFTASFRMDDIKLYWELFRLKLARAIFLAGRKLARLVYDIEKNKTS